MKNVFINEFYNFRKIGLHAVVDDYKKYQINKGDLIQDQNGDIYKVLAVSFNYSKPKADFHYLLRLEKQNSPPFGE